MPHVEKVRRNVRKEPEAIKEEVQVECEVVLTVRNGRGGKVAVRWMVKNDTVVPVAKLKLAQEPLLHVAAAECVGTASEAMLQQHGPSVHRNLMALHALIIQGGMLQVIVDEGEAVLPEKKEQESNIILAK